LNETRARADETKTALEKVTTAIEQLKSAGSEYDDLRAALDNCTSGTSEWYDALQRV